jgi:hypothetical protein
MLLCDGCDKGFHLFCTTPRLHAIPQGDWCSSTRGPTRGPQLTPVALFRAAHAAMRSLQRALERARRYCLACRNATNEFDGFEVGEEYALEQFGRKVSTRVLILYPVITSDARHMHPQ